MKNLNRLIGVLIGLVIAGYGVMVISTQEISAQGSLMRGMGWALHGTPAIINGIVIVIFGSYIIYLTITLKE